MAEKTGKANQVIITITVCLLIFFAAVFGATIFFIYKIMPQQKETIVKVMAGNEVKYLLPLGEEILVNLADTNKQRYVRLNFTIVLDSEETQQEVQKRMAQVRDLVISICRTKNSEELRGKEGNDKLRNEILTAINDILPKGKVIDIFFTDFIVT